MSKFKSLDDALEDVEARFLYNLPESELNQVDRLFFQLEQAWWFYEDFMADMNDALPHFKQLKTFAERVFTHCPLLSQSKAKFTELFNNFSAYRAQIPVCGCIMLNPDMTKAVLVCTWKGKSWGFPRGKINEQEEPLACALREVYEECGFDATAHCKEEDQLVVIEESKAIKLFVATNVPENTAFAPQTRKEISDVAFHALDDLPKTTYGVYPFIPKLRRWIAMHLKAKGKKGGRAGGGGSGSGASKSSPKVVAAKGGPVTHLKGFDSRNADTFADALAAGQGLSKGWGVADMFRANAQLTGISSSKYDGNPHSFGASHPRFVDYSKRAGAGGGAGSSSSSSSSSSSVEIGASVSVTAASLPPGRAISFASLLASAAASKAAASAAGDAALAPVDAPRQAPAAGASAASAPGGPSSSLGKRAPTQASFTFKWTAPQRLPQPFALDRREILAAVEAALQATASAAF